MITSMFVPPKPSRISMTSIPPDCTRPKPNVQSHETNEYSYTFVTIVKPIGPRRNKNKERTVTFLLNLTMFFHVVTDKRDYTGGRRYANYFFGYVSKNDYELQESSAFCLKKFMCRSLTSSSVGFSPLDMDQRQAYR